MAAYFGAIGSSLLTLRAIVDEDILHAYARAVCTFYVNLLDDLSLHITVLAIKSFDELSQPQVVGLMTDYNDVYCRLYALICDLKSHHTKESQEAVHQDWMRYHVEQLHMRYEEVMEDLHALQQVLEYGRQDPFYSSLKQPFQ